MGITGSAAPGRAFLLRAFVPFAPSFRFRTPPVAYIRLHAYAIRAWYICQHEYMSAKVSSSQAARIGTLEQLFKAMADQTRLRILALVAGGEVCVCDIHETLGIPQPRASRHLAYLRRTGLVLDRKDGLWVYYRLADPEDPVLQTLLSAVVHCLGHVQGATREARQQRPTFACCGGGTNLVQVSRRSSAR